LEGSIGSYSRKELADACRLFVRSMNKDGAGVDCVKYDGAPVYKPGYGAMGENPVADGSQFTVGVAFHTYRKTRDAELLEEILTPLVATMRAVPRNRETGLVFIDPSRPWDRCPYGFTDTVRKQGDVLFDSLLYVQAARQLSDLLRWGHRPKESPPWSAEADRVAAAVREILWDADVGLFRAATVKCREHDIWGSAFAVFLGVADPAQSLAIARYFKEHYGEIVQHGQIRHLPGGVYWEQGCARDQYQNGAYWATPTGWFVCTLDLVDSSLADRTVVDMVDDFKKHGACEWMIGERRKLPNYLASAALPLDGINVMLERRAKRQEPHPSSGGPK
jgi:glycogen debranching enzyme